MADAKSAFLWDDPFRFADQLSEEETLIRTTARDYAQDKLLPRASLGRYLRFCASVP